MVRTLLAPLVLTVALFSSAAADEKVTLRTGDGRFVTVGLDGVLRLGGRAYGPAELFEASCPAQGQIALRRPAGPYLSAAGPTGRSLVGSGPWDKPGDRQCFRLVPAGGNRVKFQARDCADPAGLDLQSPGAAAQREERFDVFLAADVPAALREQIGAAVAVLVNSELQGKEHHRETSRQREEYVDVPSPRRGDLLRTTPKRVLSVTEEQEISAALNGPLELHVDRLQALRGYHDRSTAVLLFTARARVPVHGRVRYRVPDVLSASTGYAAILEMNCTGEVCANRAGDEVVLAGELSDVHVWIRSLDLSNTVLAAARRPIEDIINRELRENQEQMRKKANESIARELGKRKIDHPLLQFLLP